MGEGRKSEFIGDHKFEFFVPIAATDKNAINHPKSIWQKA